MPYVYVPEATGPSPTGYQPVPERFPGNMRGNGIPQPGVSWTNPQPPQIPSITQPMQPPPQNNSMIWVSGKAEADGYQIPPGSAVALWDANNPVIYLRQADNTGKPSTTVYDLVERTDTPPVPQAPQLDPNKVVTWDKLDEYLTERFKRPPKATQKKEDTDNG